MIKSKDIMEDEDYKKLSSIENRNLFETYAMLGELLNPNNSFTYENVAKGWYEYLDSRGNKYFVRLTYNPTVVPFFELKTGWYDENGKLYYESTHPNSSVKDWDKRSDTVAKIFRDDIIPFFLEQDLSNTLKIFPLDIKRYQFSIRLVNKFVSNDKIEIVEYKPDRIDLIKK